MERPPDIDEGEQEGPLQSLLPGTVVDSENFLSSVSAVVDDTAPSRIEHFLRASTSPLVPPDEGIFAARLLVRGPKDMRKKSHWRNVCLTSKAVVVLHEDPNCVSLHIEKAIPLTGLREVQLRYDDGFAFCLVSKTNEKVIVFEAEDGMLMQNFIEKLTELHQDASEPFRVRSNSSVLSWSSSTLSHSVVTSDTSPLGDVPPRDTAPVGCKVSNGSSLVSCNIEFIQ